MSFFSPYRHEFLRVAACVPRIGVGDPAFNVAQTLDLVRRGDAQKIGLMIFPELGISAYAIDDLLFQDALLDRVEAAVAEIAAASRDLFPIIVVGAPLRRGGQLFNCAVLIVRVNARRLPRKRRLTVSPGACADAPIPLSPSGLRAASGAGKLSFADAGGHDVTVPLSSNGFNQAFDALAKE